MNNRIINDDFFKKVILQDATLLDNFSPVVIERKIGGDVFFEILEESSHKKINKRIINIILSKIQLNSSACGFVPKKSYYDFLRPHIQGYYFLRLDIKNFFHSISVIEVENILKQYFSNTKENTKYSPLDIATKSILYKPSSSCQDEDLRNKEILPIGFPSSPVISNIIFRRVDILIQKFCDGKGITYSRYADDMLFSSAKSHFLHTEQFEKEISIFISILSLQLKKRKRKATKNTISLNGYVIQNKTLRNDFFSSFEKEPVGTIRLSDKKLKKLKKLTALLRKKETSLVIMQNLFGLNLENCKKNWSYNFISQYAEDQLQNKLKGYRSYLIALIKYDEKYHCVDKNCVTKIKGLVKTFENKIK